MNGGPSGFNNAPVTRAIIIFCAIFTVFFGLKGRSTSSNLALPFQDDLQKPRLWKTIISMFTFTSTSELMFGLYLLYYFRVFERQIGSNKYSVFILFSVAVSFILQSIAFAFLKDRSALISSGPYSLIFASFVPFFFDIPVSKRFQVLGVHFSDKSFIYLAGLQMLLSSWKRSILPGGCGILAGSLYRMNIFCIRRAKVPRFIASLFSLLSWPSTTTSSPSSAPRSRTTNVSANAAYAGRQVQRNSPSRLINSVEPSEESLAMLISMGFDGDSARQALVQAGNDINVATNILLESHSH